MLKFLVALLAGAPGLAAVVTREIMGKTHVSGDYESGFYFMQDLFLFGFLPFAVVGIAVLVGSAWYTGYPIYSARDPSRLSPRLQAMLAAGAAIAIFIGALLPWASKRNVVADEISIVALIASLVALAGVALSLYGRNRLGGMIAALCGIAGGAAGIMIWLEVLYTHWSVQVGVGVGVVLVSLGGMVLTPFGGAMTVSRRAA